MSALSNSAAGQHAAHQLDTGKSTEGTIPSPLPALNQADLSSSRELTGEGSDNHLESFRRLNFDWVAMAAKAATARPGGAARPTVTSRINPRSSAGANAGSGSEGQQQELSPTGPLCTKKMSMDTSQAAASAATPPSTASPPAVPIAASSHLLSSSHHQPQQHQVRKSLEGHPAPAAALPSSELSASQHPSPNAARAATATVEKKDLTSTPAAPSLRRSRIPPMIPLDAPRSSASASSGSVRHTQTDEQTPTLPEGEAGDYATSPARGDGAQRHSMSEDTVDTAMRRVPQPPGCSTAVVMRPKKRGSRLNTAFANIGRGAAEQQGGVHDGADGTPRRERVRRVSFKEGDVVALPDSKSLRTPMTALLVFRNPTMREQGKEMTPAPAEVYAQLLQRGTAVCTLAVVDEDAMRRPCLVASGFTVRVFEEDRALTLGQRRAARGGMRALQSFRNRVRGGAERESSGSRTPDDGDGGDGLGEAQSGEFDQFLHKVVFDETLSRPKGESGCDSVTLQLLARRWESGQNTSLVFGNGSGRSIQCYDVAVGVVRDALAKLRERLRDASSTAQLQMHMGDVFADEATGEVRVQDLLVCPSDSDSDSDSESTSTSEREDEEECSAATSVTAAAAAAGASKDEPAAVNRFPQVRLFRSPVMGTFVKGLSTVNADDALSDASCIFRALGQGFSQYNVSTHSSRNTSFVSLPKTAGAGGAHTCFAVLRLTTTCRGCDMRGAPLSAREATTVGEERVPHVAKRKRRHFNRRGRASDTSTLPVMHRRTTACAADVVVSTLLLTFFGTEYHVFKTIVEHKLIAGKQARGAAFVDAPGQLTWSATGWTSPIHFLYSLLMDGLGGRTHTVTCLCLSEYDSQVTPWLHVMERARAIVNAEPNSGDLRNYLVYLLDQYENLDAQQWRERKGMGARPRGLAPGSRPSPSPAAMRSLQSGEISMYFVQKLVNTLDRFLSDPVGEPPLLERLEIRSAEALPQLTLPPLPIPNVAANKDAAPATTSD